MARVYVYLDSDREPLPDVLEKLYAVQRFGGQAVYGGPIPAKDIREMTWASMIETAYIEKNVLFAEKQAEWVQNNKDRDNWLAQARMVAIEEGWLDDE